MTSSRASADDLQEQLEVGPPIPREGGLKRISREQTWSHRGCEEATLNERRPAE